MSPKKVWKSPTLTNHGTLGQLTRGNTLSGTDGSSQLTNQEAMDQMLTMMDLMGMMMMSDRRTKENIAEIGLHPLGIPLYSYNYKSEFARHWGEGEMIGLMADEVEQILPDAVRADASGYRMIDYSRVFAEMALHTAQSDH